MLIQLLFRHQINDQAWDELINQSPQGIIYALSWYLDLVSPNWAALVLFQNNNYEVIMPLPLQKKMSITYIQQPLFCQQLGIFARSQAINQPQMQAFANQLVKHFRYVAAYQFNIHNPLVLFAQQQVYANKQQLLYTHLIDLQAHTAKEIRQHYNQDRQLNLKRALKAQQNGISTEQSTTLTPLLDLFRQEVAHKIQGGVAAEAYVLLSKLVATLHKKDLAVLYYTVNPEQEKEAGALFTTYRGQIIYLFNAGARQYSKNNGRTHLIDTMLTSNAKKAVYFDFESPAIQPIAEFYQSFGATAKPFLHWHYNNLPYILQLAKRLKQQIYQFNLIKNQL
jgi:hypothetical protein